VSGVVYFIEAVGTGRIKIGRTNNLTRRLTELQANSPHVLLVRKTIKTYDMRAVELELHRRFAYARAEGEWFRYTAALADEVGGPPTGDEPVPDVSEQLTALLGERGDNDL